MSKQTDKVRALRGHNLIDELRRGPCADCGKTYQPCQMEFDHREGTAKTRNVADMVSRSESIIRAEIVKCDLVCANCHRLRTHARGQQRRGIPSFLS